MTQNLTSMGRTDLNSVIAEFLDGNVSILKKYEDNYSIFKSSSVKTWIINKMRQYTQNNKDAKKFNMTGYLNSLQKYAEFFTCENIDDLVQDNVDERNAKLYKYLEKQIKDGKNPVSIANGEQSKIKSFFSDRGSPIPYQMDCWKHGLNENEITLDQSMIQKIEHSFNSPMYRVLIKTQAQLGLRIDDLLTSFVSGKYHIEKFKNHYFVRNFITTKENVCINYLFFPTELTNLIISATNIQDLTQLDLKDLFSSRFGGKISQSNYLTRMKEVCQNLGFSQNVKTHSFRKYFCTQVGHANLDIEFRESLMGHTQNNLSDAYNRDLANIEVVYQKWLIVEPFLCIDSTIIDKTDDRVAELKKDMEKEKALNKKIIEDQASEINELKIKLAKILDLMTEIKK